MKKIIIALVFILTACATPTPYGKYGRLGGYVDNRIDANTFSISVNNNAFTTQQTTSMHAFYRAAELTVENGFDYFVIVSGANNSTSAAAALQGNSYAPIIMVPIVFPNQVIVIRSFKGPKPNDQVNAYNALEVMKYLGPQIGVGQKPEKGTAQ
ncbi:MAG: hypothetical protein Q8K51_14325 [Nitrospirota bacterium]|nr:hypothetical protein [Nitrospirota bacterium]